MNLVNCFGFGAAAACLTAAALLNPASGAPMPAPVAVAPTKLNAKIPKPRKYEEVSSDMNDLNGVGGPQKKLSAAEAAAAANADLLAAIRGEDKNHNGMRDDAERYLPRNAHTLAQKAALIRLVSAYTDAMTTPLNDTLALSQAANALMHAKQCMAVAFKGQGTELNNAFMVVAVNTTPRMHAYHQFKQALSGVAIVRTKGENCD